MERFINSPARHGGTYDRQGWALSVRDDTRFRTAPVEQDGMRLVVCADSRDDALDIAALYLQARGIEVRDHETLVVRPLPGAVVGAPLHWPVEQAYRG